jgi:uncharacterized protein YkwD
MNTVFRGRWCLAAALLSCAAAATATTDCGVPVPAAMRDDALRLTNAVRAVARDCGVSGHFDAVPPLVWSVALEAVADRQAQWLAPRLELSHLDASGRSLGERAGQAGYRYGRIVENLAHGQLGVEQVIEGWALSDRHCANLMDAAVSEAALVCRIAADLRPLWVMVLARPR